MDPITLQTTSYPRLIGKYSTQLKSDFPDSFCPNQLAQLIDQQSTRPGTTHCHVSSLLRFYGCVPSCTLLSEPWYTVVLPAWYTAVHCCVYTLEPVEGKQDKLIEPQG